MNRDKSTLLEKIVLGIIVGIPLVAFVVYVLNTRGFFTADTTTPVPTVSNTPAPIQPIASPAVLSVDNPSALPSSIAAGEIVPFSFTIQNPGNAQASYPYKVYVQWENGEQDVIDENSVSLASSASQSIPESLKFEIASTSAEIFIEIQKPMQTIHFTLPSTQ